MTWSQGLEIFCTLAKTSTWKLKAHLLRLKTRGGRRILSCWEGHEPKHTHYLMIINGLLGSTTVRMGIINYQQRCCDTNVKRVDGKFMVQSFEILCGCHFFLSLCASKFEIFTIQLAKRIFDFMSEVSVLYIFQTTNGKFLGHGEWKMEDIRSGPNAWSADGICWRYDWLLRWWYW